MSLIDFKNRKDIICIKSNNGNNFYFYRDILIDLSVVLSNMLNSSMIERNGTITIDRSSDVINLFLNKLISCCYDDLTLENAFDLYDIANCYQIDKIKILVERYLISSVESICTNITCINKIIFYDMKSVINKIIDINSYGMNYKIKGILESVKDSTPEVIKSGILCGCNLKYQTQIINKYIDIYPEFKGKVKELICPLLSGRDHYIRFETLDELIRLLKLVPDLEFNNELLMNILLNNHTDRTYTIKDFKC